MGYRLHVRKINRVEYGTGLFNHGHQAIMPILREMSEDISVDYDNDEIEMPKDDFKAGIENLKNLSDDEFRKKYPEVFKEYPKETKETIVKNLEVFLEEADPENDTIAFDWY